MLPSYRITFPQPFSSFLPRISHFEDEDHQDVHPEGLERGEFHLFCNEEGLKELSFCARKKLSKTCI